MLKILLLVSLAIGPTWLDYAFFNAHITTLALHVPEAKVTCTYPESQGHSRCIGKLPTKTIYMLCPAFEYNYCEVFVRKEDE